MLDAIKTLSLSKQSSKSAIASFLLDNLAFIEELSLEDIAKQSYTSKASIVRFAQALGFKGWTDFFPALISERHYNKAHYSNIDHSLPFSDQDDAATIIQKIATIEKESIQDTADKLSAQDIEKASDLIQTAHRVVIFGVSPNEYIAHLFKRKMLAIGKRVEVAHSSEFGLMSASLHQGDIAIIISYSGNSKDLESLKYIPLLKKKKVKIIALTSQHGNYLRQESDACFTICTREDKVKKIGNFSTEESILFILNSLYAVYFKKDYFANYVRKVNFSNDLEGQRQ